MHSNLAENTVSSRVVVIIHFLSLCACDLSTSSIAACPGMCNYRFYTLTECGPGNNCQCNMAYSGANCDIPQYAPTSVQATYNVTGAMHSITVSLF